MFVQLRRFFRSFIQSCVREYVLEHLQEMVYGEYYCHVPDDMTSRDPTAGAQGRWRPDGGAPYESFVLV